MCGRRTCILAVTRRNDSSGRPARGGKPRVDGAPERRTIFDTPGKVNHRGWIVLTSVSSADGAYCVDLFEDPNGGYGFEHFRSEPRTTVAGLPSGRSVGPASQVRPRQVVPHRLRSTGWHRIDGLAPCLTITSAADSSQRPRDTTRRINVPASLKGGDLRQPVAEAMSHAEAIVEFEARASRGYG